MQGIYRDRVPTWARIFLSALAILLSVVVARDLFGEVATRAGDCRHQVWYAAQKLQPWYRQAVDPIARSKRAKALTEFTDAVCVETTRHGIDPLLAVAIAFRESSILPSVGRGERNGTRGEQGYFQVLPGGGAERFAPAHCVSQHVASCNAATAMAYLAWLRDENCPSETPATWIGAYGRGQCADSATAEGWPEVRVARRFLCEIDEDCETTWPYAQP